MKQRCSKGNDLTHPVPDNTGYITEGQLYLDKGVINPFGSLSRLKQLVMGHETREDHGAIANELIRIYADALKVKEKQSMGFSLNGYDKALLKYAYLFEKNFMQWNVAITLEEALDCGWKILQDCFRKSELGMRMELIEKYWKGSTT